MSSDHFVSILIPCWNAEKWIGQCIESAIGQTYRNKEVIVWDDGSTDRSFEIIKSFGDDIRWRSWENHGANPARNKLLELSNGEWIQYLDADDYLYPQKIQEQVQFLAEHPDADVIYSPVMVEEIANEREMLYLLKMPSKDDFFVNFARWGPLQTSGFLWKKEALQAIGAWREDQSVCQEHELIFRLIMVHRKFCLFNNANSVYRYSNNMSVSRKSKKTTIEQRMHITDELERYLRKNDLLSNERKEAINLSRFESARSIYSIDKIYAQYLIDTIKSSNIGFMPKRTQAAPFTYCFLYRIFGFSLTERIASLARRIK